MIFAGVLQEGLNIGRKDAVYSVFNFPLEGAIVSQHYRRVQAYFAFGSMPACVCKIRPRFPAAGPRATHSLHRCAR
jgi:hypothetical protein